MNPAQFVLDASVALSWYFPDQQRDSAQDLKRRLIQGEEAIVPAVFSLELVYVLAEAERSRGASASASGEFLDMVMGLSLLQDRECVLEPMAFGRILDLCRQFRLSSHDACYLELAIRLGIPIATYDLDLIRAARKSGIDVLSSEAA